MEIYYVIFGMLALLSVFGLIVGVSNDACNFLNSSIGCRAGTYNQAVAVAAVGVLLGACFSSGMMSVARNGVIEPAMFTFHEVMILYLAVMVGNIILLDTFNTLGLPTSTTVSLVFSLLGAAIGMAIYTSGELFTCPLADYINEERCFKMIVAIFASVAIAFTVGSVVMWLSRLIFSFRFQKMYRLIGPLWCGLAFTAISYFIIFKGLKGSVFKEDIQILVEQGLTAPIVIGAGIFWVIFSAVLQYICKINTLRIAVLAGTGSLALAFAGNDMVNFIGVFMASKDALFDPAVTPDVVNSLKMGEILAGDGAAASTTYLLSAGLIMVAALFFSKKARKVTETELKLSSSNTGKERFGSSQPARIIVRTAINTARFITSITPGPIARFVGERFRPLTAEEETGANYDMIRASVNLTIAALLISVGTDLGLPLSTTYVIFMVSMGTSLADRAWGRDSAVYRITGVLTVIAGWLLTGVAASVAALIVALIMAYGGTWGMIAMLIIAGVLLIKSTFFTHDDKQEIRLIDVNKDASVHEFAAAAAGRLGRMIGIYKAMVKALLEEDLDDLKRLRKKARSIKRDLEVIKENEVLPTLPTIPADLADRGQLIFRITEISITTCERLSTLVKASYNHIDNFHAGLSRQQANDLLTLTEKIGRFYPNLIDMLKAGDYAGIKAMLETTEQLSDDFADCITRHLMHSTANETDMRNGILYLTLLNETRAMVSHGFALIQRIRELYEG
ncbi:MAG: inorganic phosphate transporter [Akkermansia sp.]|nr:inorganic phosphate transporter [Akkermansia sp.]